MAEHRSNANDVLASGETFLSQMDSNACHVAQSIAKSRSGVTLVFRLEATDER